MCCLQYCICIGVIGNVLSNSHLQFIILQPNIDIIKVENDADIQSEGGSIGMETEEVHIPSAFSVKEAEPKVSHIFRGFFIALHEFVSVFVCLQGRRMIKFENVFFFLFIWKTF
jgi:hypothetical protein